MNSGRHVDRWLSGLLAAVCVLLIRSLIGEIKSSILPLCRRPAVAARRQSVPKVSPAAPTHERERVEGFRRLGSSTLAETGCGVGRLTDCPGLAGPDGPRPTVTPTTRPHVPSGAGMPPTITSASTSSPDLAAAQPTEKPAPPQEPPSAPAQPAVAVVRPIGYVVEHKGHSATDGGQFPLPVEIAKDLFQRPPPGILPFEDVDASPGQLAPGDGQVRLPDTLSRPTALGGNSGKAHPGPCRRRKAR